MTNKPGHALPPGKQWNAHELSNGRAARRRLKQMASGKIDEGQLALSGKLALSMLNGQPATSLEKQALAEAIKADVNAKPGTIKYAMGAK